MIKRAAAILRRLGVKRAIASAVLGVMFPLLFAAWVASGPRSIHGFMNSMENTRFYQTDHATGTLISRPATRTFIRNYRWPADPANDTTIDALFVETNRLEQGMPSLTMPVGGQIATEWRYTFGWPVAVLSYQEARFPTGPVGPGNVASVPFGWWYWVIGPGTIPLSIDALALGLNWLFYAPLFYLLFSVVPVIRHVRRRRRGLCTRCGYDLAGLESCPECGAGPR